MQQRGFHLFFDFEGIVLPGIVVPQEVYSTGQGAVGPQQFPPVIFSVGQRVGVRLRDLLDGDGTFLDDAEATPSLTQNRSARISIRINVSPISATSASRLNMYAFDSGHHMMRGISKYILSTTECTIFPEPR